MKTINNGKFITNKQIESFIGLLGKEYKPSQVVIYETYFDIIRFYPQTLNFSIEELFGKLEGIYDPNTDTVYICIFAQTDDGDDLHSKQLYSLHAFAHELRHRYQLYKNIYNDQELESERDADRFATNFINKNSHKISNIMGWKDQWLVEEEDE